MGDWVACPHCGERISKDAKSCRHCGSDEATGWSESTYLDGVDLPEADDYEEGLEKEGFREAPASSSRWLMAGASILLIALFALWLLRGLLS